MSRILRIALAQTNPCLGDIQGNTKKIIQCIKSAEDASVDIVAFAELAITGYPPEDLLLRHEFIKANLSALEEIKRHTSKTLVVVGFVDKTEDIYNASALIHSGRVVHVYHKIYLPSYSVFDEDRYFKAGTQCAVYKARDFCFGINICEDIWYPDGPAYKQALAGAELIVNINASPFSTGKFDFKKKMLCMRAHDSSAFVAYVNLCGGQDELVFDGGSMIVDPNGNLIAQSPRFREHLLIADINLDEATMKRLHDPRGRKKHLEKVQDQVMTLDLDLKLKQVRDSQFLPTFFYEMSTEEEIYSALVFGLKDYVKKNSFHKVCIGLSGGVDSSLVAKIAVDALGKENVIGVFMPSRFTSEQSKADAYQLATNLGIRLLEIPIEGINQAFIAELSPFFEGLKPDITEENLQSRIRGVLLMALSNKFGYLVLTTGNKSEMSVGYATLYGDMAGGFAVLKDVNKTLVYRLCRWINQTEKTEVIPESVLTKAPTAELRENQKDTDSLPPYEVLDRVIEAYIEQDRSIDEIIETTSIDRAELQRVIAMIDRSEYKRRQSPIGVKITQRAFGRDRRYPITKGYNRSLAD